MESKRDKEADRTMKRLFLTLSLALTVSLCACGGGPQETASVTNDDAVSVADADAVSPAPTVALSGEQNVVITGYDWGAGVSKTVVMLDRAVMAESVTPEAFSVIESREEFDYAGYASWEDGLLAEIPAHTVRSEQREVKAAYPCDPDGNRVSRNSDTVALELVCDPEHGTPYCFDMVTGRNALCNPYELSISLTPESAVMTANGERVTGLSVSPVIDFDRAAVPQLDGVDLSGSFTGADWRELRYASYAPPANDRKHPLVIWLHGDADGGEDPSIPLLGAKATAFLGNEFQELMGGAYVLIPQAPDFWMVYNDNGDWEDNPGAASVYTSTLMTLIQSYVESNPGIDEDRIYIGGCSGGGYMVLNMTVNYPSIFAAAFPICEAYPDSGLSDAQLQRVRRIPFWFVYAEDDDVIDPETHAVPTIARLRGIGAEVHVSALPEIADASGLRFTEDGRPYSYSGHWAWIPFLNRECQDDGLDMWTWLASQAK